MFTYSEDKLSIKTDHGIDVEFLFDGDDCTHVSIDGYEYKTTEDFLHGIFVGLKNELISVAGLTRKAKDAYPDILREVRQDAKDYDNHIKSYRGAL